MLFINVMHEVCGNFAARRGWPTCSLYTHDKHCRWAWVAALQPHTWTTQPIGMGGRPVAPTHEQHCLAWVADLQPPHMNSTAWRGWPTCSPHTWTALLGMVGRPAAPTHEQHCRLAWVAAQQSKHTWTALPLGMGRPPAASTHEQHCRLAWVAALQPSHMVRAADRCCLAAQSNTGTCAHAGFAFYALILTLTSRSCWPCTLRPHAGLALYTLMPALHFTCACQPCNLLSLVGLAIEYQQTGRVMPRCVHRSSVTVVTQDA